MTCSSTLSACTAFETTDSDGHIRVGKSFDYPTGVGFVLINQRGQPKNSSVTPGDNAARWTAKYGSVTMNMYCKEAPFSGMNEKGLVVEILWHFNSEYPQPDDRLTITETGWVQYALDNCATVDEVLATDEKIRITNPFHARLHYFVVDASGNCAVVEWVGGRRVVYTGKDLPVRALVNQNYAHSLELMRTNPVPVDGRAMQNPEWRFELVSKDRPADIKGDAGVLALLDRAHFDAMPGMMVRSQWNIAYDITTRTILFRTVGNWDVRRLDLRRLHFGYEDTQRYIDIDAPQSALDAEWPAYSPETIKPIVMKAYASTDIIPAPPEAAIDNMLRASDHVKIP